MDFDLAELEGKRLGLYGVDGNRFKLGGSIYEAIEDESDGYRSYLGSVVVYPKELLENKPIFFDKPVAMVTCKSVDDPDGFQGHEFVDDAGHVWLAVGTDHSDDYYPWFVFNYEPKQG